MAPLDVSNDAALQKKMCHILQNLNFWSCKKDLHSQGQQLFLDCSDFKKIGQVWFWWKHWTINSIGGRHFQN